MREDIALDCVEEKRESKRAEYREENELKLCPFCEQFEIDKYDEICDSCKGELLHKFSKIIKSNFTDDEIKIIDDEIDGNYIVELIKEW